MLRPRTLKILAAILVGYGAIVLCAYRGPEALQEIAAPALLAPYLSLHLFNHLGVPGLLEHEGNCGWGLCAPSLPGWVFAVVLWLTIAWLAAWAIATIFRPRTAFDGRQSGGDRQG